MEVSYGFFDVCSFQNILWSMKNGVSPKTPVFSAD